MQITTHFRIYIFKSSKKQKAALSVCHHSKPEGIRDASWCPSASSHSPSSTAQASSLQPTWDVTGELVEPQAELPLQLTGAHV